MRMNSPSGLSPLSIIAAAVLADCDYRVDVAGLRDSSGLSGRGVVELSGQGYVHYHLYPEIGQCYCGVEYDFGARDMMVAAISESVHSYYGERLCQDRKYAHVTSLSTGARVRVLIVDKGGMPIRDYALGEQHIMDLSQEAFRALDVDGNGYVTGRIYVKWELAPADLSDEPLIRFTGAERRPTGPR